MTDGSPNQDLRPDCEAKIVSDPTLDGICPDRSSATIAAELAAAHGVVTYVVAFGTADTAGRALGCAAAANGTDVLDAVGE